MPPLVSKVPFSKNILALAGSQFTVCLVLEYQPIVEHLQRYVVADIAGLQLSGHLQLEQTSTHSLSGTTVDNIRAVRLFALVGHRSFCLSRSHSRSDFPRREQTHEDSD